MEWWLALLLILGSVLVLMLSGMPVAFCFFIVTAAGVFFLWGGEPGLRQLILSIRQSLAHFSLLPVPLFILMGEIMFRSGLAPLMLDSLDKWLGRLPGRLSLLAVAGGTLFSAMSGSTMATTAMLGSILVPDMQKRGYKKPMTIGPILGSGGLSIMIPPTGLGILLAAIGEISVGGLLIGIIMPGLLMATFYATYIIGRCWLQPSLSPAYDVAHVPLAKKLLATVRNILPLGLIIFLVVGLIFLGVATPSEAAAMGAIGSIILAASLGRLNWGLIKKSVSETLSVTVMAFMIIGAAKAFAQILAYTGASRSLVEIFVDLPLTPIFIIVAMQVVVLLLGMFMSVVAIMMITLPIFMPVIITLGFDPVWFGVIMLLNIEMATTSPPFGTGLFVMKGVVPADVTMGDIYRAALPFLGCDAIVMALMIAFPQIVLWLPGLMQ